MWGSHSLEQRLGSLLSVGVVSGAQGQFNFPLIELEEPRSLRIPTVHLAYGLLTPISRIEWSSLDTALRSGLAVLLFRPAQLACASCSLPTQLCWVLAFQRLLEVLLICLQPRTRCRPLWDPPSLLVQYIICLWKVPPGLIIWSW